MQLTVAIACVLALTAPSAGAATFVWSGQDPTDGSWSHGANWVGGTAPSGSVDVLEFPPLTSPECDSSPYQATCLETFNDISGLNVGELRIDGSTWYELKGNGITLGPGGLTLLPVSAPGTSDVAIPLLLSTNQTWHLEAGRISVTGGITGNADLTIPLGSILLGGVNELGHVTLQRGSQTPGGWCHCLTLLGDSTTLNATSGNGVGADGVSLGGTGTLGELTTSNAEIGAFRPYDASIHPIPVSLPYTLNVSGDVTLDPGSRLPLQVSRFGLDQYSRLTASGNVDLASAKTSLTFGNPQEPNACGADPPVGHVFTLVSTTGTVTGQFAGLPDGVTIHPYEKDYYDQYPEPGYRVYCPQHLLRLDYTAHSVTATVVERTVHPPDPFPTPYRPPTNPVLTPAPTTQGPTGQRAAALKKCKKKLSKKARRKCRAKAERLPI